MIDNKLMKKLCLENYKINKDKIYEEVKKVKELNKITPKQYEIITGSCKEGVELFCKKHNITDEGISLDKLKPLLKGRYTSEFLWNLLEDKPIIF